jgi:hypothetical protein
MNDIVRSHKRKFNYALEPIKVMLVHQQNILKKKEWLSFVERTKLSVIHQPEQYIGQDLPERKMLTDIVTTIFEEFLRETDAFPRKEDTARL